MIDGKATSDFLPSDEKPLRSRGEIFEGIAFQFCKVATVALIAGRWTLPLAAGLGGIFFLLTYFNGIRRTRCIVRYPLLAGIALLLICAASIWWQLR